MENLIKVFLLISLSSLGTAKLPIEETVFKSIKETGSASIFISFKTGTEKTFSEITSKASRISSRTETLDLIYDSLNLNAFQTQKNILQKLNSLQVSHESFWVSNQIYIKHATPVILASLEEFSNEISSISQELVLSLAEATIESETSRPMAPEWGVQNVEAPAVWDLGINGSRARVATIATGVRGTHESIVKQFLGNYGWYDPADKTQTPEDDIGQGTMITGTILGDFEIGIAPEARWMACKGCTSFSCFQSDLMACGQYTLAPTDTSGENANSSYAPHVVANAWGGGRGGSFYDTVIAAWKIAGIIAVFPNGVSDSCGSVAYPAEHRDVVGSSGMDSINTVPSGASAGPGSDGGIKPNCVGPSVLIKSASHTSDSAYIVISGGAMGAAHTSGVLALIFDRGLRDGFGEKTALGALHFGAQPTRPTGKNCGDIDEEIFPNNMAGHGKVNARVSYEYLEIPPSQN